MSLNARTGIANAMDRLEQDLLEIGSTRVADDLPSDDLATRQFKRHASQTYTNISLEADGRETIVWREAR